MTRNELKKLVKAAVPSVSFTEKDGLGTATPKYRLECFLLLEDVPALEALAASINKRAYSIHVLDIYGCTTRCINVKGH